jgi:hypothetical protein
MDPLGLHLVIVGTRYASICSCLFIHRRTQRICRPSNIKIICLPPNIKRLQLQGGMTRCVALSAMPQRRIGLVVKLDQYVFRRDGENKHESFGRRVCGALPD